MKLLLGSALWIIKRTCEHVTCCEKCPLCVGVNREYDETVEREVTSFSCVTDSYFPDEWEIKKIFKKGSSS